MFCGNISFEVVLCMMSVCVAIVLRVASFVSLRLKRVFYDANNTFNAIISYVHICIKRPFCVIIIHVHLLHFEHTYAFSKLLNIELYSETQETY